MDFEKLAWECLEWIKLSQNRGQRLMVIVKEAMNLRFMLHDAARSASF
jgi:hypothetical protein